MSNRMYRSLQALILALTGLFLLTRILSGRITWYINARFVPLTLVGAIGLLILARTLITERSAAPDPDDDHGEAVHGHDHGPLRSGWGLLALVFPVLIGFLIPNRPLGSEALTTRGVSVTAPLTAAAEGQPLQLELSPTERSILDWIRVVSLSEDPTSIEGQQADVIGFAYHDPRLTRGQVLLGRFTITCCVADATAIALIVEGEAVEGMTNNTWYRVLGPVSLTALEGKVLPVVRAEQVEEIPMPDQPYLYN